MIGPELTLQLIVVRFLAGVIIATVQGAAIAAVTVLLGDKGPRYDGRLTLSPAAHVDLLGLGSLMLTGFGWSKPVTVDPGQMRVGPWVLPLAGSAALLLLGWLVLFLVIPALTILPHTQALLVGAFLRSLAQLCVWMALFTLLPAPPLVGAHFLAALNIRLPARASLIIGLLLVVLSIVGVTRAILAPAYQLVAPLVVGAELGR
ncbi:hypothetical protein IC608_10360 [Devosia sp. PTR5]|uniref:Uncharacterized protein n=1 Tax=Devosia oryzisoli TaxID=2774138 RepID=A0A927FW09_9HYPH|nr:hypothetical protein [Devosia oryzisoli]MBD8065878.1 hypothetical protein [Devosia oryzisoli]